MPDTSPSGMLAITSHLKFSPFHLQKTDFQHEAAGKKWNTRQLGTFFDFLRPIQDSTRRFIGGGRAQKLEVDGPKVSKPGQIQRGRRTMVAKAFASNEGTAVNPNHPRIIDAFSKICTQRRLCPQCTLQNQGCRCFPETRTQQSPGSQCSSLNQEW